MQMDRIAQTATIWRTREKRFDQEAASPFLLTCMIFCFHNEIELLVCSFLINEIVCTMNRIIFTTYNL